MQNSLASILSSIFIHAGVAGLVLAYQPQLIKPLDEAEMVFLDIKEGPTPKGNSPIPQIRPIKKIKKKKPKPVAKKVIAPKPIQKIEQAPQKESAKVVTQKQESPIKAAPERAETVAAVKPDKASSFGIESGIRDARSLQQRKGNKPPAYPQRDRLHQREGHVVVLGYVNEQGFIRQLKLESSTGSKEMDRSALSAFSRYRFEKGQRGWVRMPFQFALKGPTETIKSARSRTSRQRVAR